MDAVGAVAPARAGLVQMALMGFEGVVGTAAEGVEEDLQDASSSTLRQALSGAAAGHEDQDEDESTHEPGAPGAEPQSRKRRKLLA